MLLVAEAQAEPLTRDHLKALVRRKLSAPDVEPEADLLEALVAMEPQVVDPQLAAAAREPLGTPRATSDLLGLHIDRLPMRKDGKELVSVESLTDPVLTRALTMDERASLATRRYALLIRADYRNRRAVLGLRLLQHLVALVGEERGALIHDPDTFETVGIAEFSRRRLHASLDNVADQIAVVPFPDPRHASGLLRLTTRGMRRFGSVDLELDGLPRDPAVLQAGTDLLYGLARQMVELGEFDSTGYAVELPQVVSVHRDDVARAYGRDAQASQACPTCDEEVEVHLVERTAEAHDPGDHVVARVVAPRSVSDDPAYDQPRWARDVLRRLLGTSG